MNRGSIGRFTFDGAEGLAFHIYSNEDQEKLETSIMFSDLEELHEFLVWNLPGMFDLR